MSRSPWVGGSYEVRHRSIAAALRSLSVESSASQWHLDVPLIQLRLNLQIDEDTGFTPHSLVFGYDACFPLDLALLTPQSELSNRLGKSELSSDTVKKILQSFAERRRKIHELWAEAWERNRAAYAKKLQQPAVPSSYNFNEGDLVLVRNPRKTKLDNLWRGPYVVRRVLGSATYDVDTGSSKIPYVQHQRNLKPWLGEDGDTVNSSPVGPVCDCYGNDIKVEAFYGLPNRLFGHPISLKELQVFRLSGANIIEPVIDVNGDPMTVFIEQP
ncbi:hypothetical protein Pmar_PMAR004232 [Perkinsus marinus ATCC 50983]|uniref:Integrase zinc-binding domain-containing protein n=1 Tax=Perkinsus marinus (strain ATCC 50983 / TXsc) TaxID=423536 RepID=C5LPN8_PERM5|nr:hypothetical protein Pmar_PMAR004232 [Perkinsus marinus ATCC 50983]EER01358.1 hypothetical protein Pmar_PMAR004232 [Perkinsus marinus ATCC 50983]|eukprot:XP_002768640.1 hypothetical protein Pmar_PMAR004232 [Perkinsus marinus ATCC 50983]